MEAFKTIQNHSQYIIYRDGTIKRIEGARYDRPVKQWFNVVKGKEYPNGYMYVTLLTKDDKDINNEHINYPGWYCYGVHRLVALAFIPNPNNLPEVNHKDGNKLNNNIDNLEWVSKSDNIKHSFNTLNREVKRGSDHWHYGKKKSESTKKLISEAIRGKNHPKFKGFYMVHHLKYYSSFEAAAKTGENQRTIIRKCKKGAQGSEYYFIPVEKSTLSL